MIMERKPPTTERVMLGLVWWLEGEGYYTQAEEMRALVLQRDELLHKVQKLTIINKLMAAHE
jgi:hypothetical protein